jgi:hypothetical protein
MLRRMYESFEDGSSSHARQLIDRFKVRAAVRQWARAVMLAITTTCVAVVLCRCAPCRSVRRA